MQVLQISNNISSSIEEARTTIQNAIEQQLNTVSAIIFCTKQEMDIKIKKLECSVMTEIQSLKNSINKISNNNNNETRVNILESELRKKNIILNGIPQSNSENIHHIVQKIGKYCGVMINTTDIEVASRLISRKSESTNTPPNDPAILVKIFSKNVKSKLFSGYL
jgi:phage-related protein